MRNQIQILPSSVANQIAAGEVVLRPASVVKELLENSVDAHASKIEVVLRNSGNDLIQIIDNGHGMSSADARLAFEKHATSKIKSIEDLQSLHSFGFRGEALPSIAAVAEVVLRTSGKDDESGIGTLIEFAGGQFKRQEVCSCTIGTSVEVRNIFYNVPARRKFLKAPQVELSMVMQEIERVALVHPEIEFTLVNNGKTMLHLTPANDTKRISQLFGDKVQDSLVRIESYHELLNVAGYISNIESATKKNRHQFLFVNGRYIHSSYLHKAVLKAIDKMLPADAQPSYFIGKKFNGTLIEALEIVLSEGKGSHLAPQFFNAYESEFCHICNHLSVNPFQAFVIALIIEEEGSITTSEIASYAHCSNLCLARYASDFDDLVARRYLHRCVRHYHGDERNGYYISRDLVRSIKEGKKYTPRPLSALTSMEVLSEIEGMMKNINKGSKSRDQIVVDIRTFLKEVRHLGFADAIDKAEFDDDELLVFLVAICLSVLRGDFTIAPCDIDFLFDDRLSFEMVIDDLASGDFGLCKRKLFEPSCADGQVVPNHFQLTRKAETSILSEFKVFKKQRSASHSSDLLMPTEINQKQLYFNAKEGDQIADLTRLLGKKNFRSIQKRLKTVGMRPGFACLFYGAPGTGKTESVLQLAKSTGRAIYKVDVSNLRDKYVGESEKQVKGIFDTYRQMVASSKVCPILFFNEADAIFGVRKEAASSSVDKMENAIQNIILQEMESLDGILIATTNLTQNMDKAFERRFLYKIEFKKPDVNVKAQIWRSMLPNLDMTEALKLASCYDFIGGQIENIARKQIVDSILYDIPMSIESICRCCDSELICRKNSNTIGFVCN